MVRQHPVRPEHSTAQLAIAHWGVLLSQHHAVRSLLRSSHRGSNWLLPNDEHHALLVPKRAAKVFPMQQSDVGLRFVQLVYDASRWHAGHRRLHDSNSAADRSHRQNILGQYMGHHSLSQLRSVTERGSTSVQHVRRWQLFGVNWQRDRVWHVPRPVQTCWHVS